MRDELKRRTRQFALDVIRFSRSFPRRAEFEIIKGQLIRAATSVGSNYRAACRSRSRREFISKIGIVSEEGDEAQYWLELVEELSTGDKSKIKLLEREAAEIVAIMVASINTPITNHQ
ncbi:MAG: four helix bundle protein [Acidobacteriota bacterium]